MQGVIKSYDPGTAEGVVMRDTDRSEYDLSPAGGDLFVLGGRAPRDLEHSVPKVAGASSRAGRISGQWRWTSGKGRPELGASYAAPRNFSRR